MPIISHDELAAIPAPERTKTWNPIPHTTIMDQVNKVFEDMGVTVLNTRIDAQKDGKSVFVTHRINQNVTTESYLELGWRNSIDKSLALGFTSGSHIMVCSNLVFSGEWIQYRKHTSGLEPEEVYNLAHHGLTTAFANTNNMQDLYLQMKERKLTKEAVDLLFMQMLRTGTVTGGKMLSLVNAYDEESARYGDTLYTVFNCVTQTFRDQSLQSISRKSSLLTQTMNEVCLEDHKTEQPVYLSV